MEKVSYQYQPLQDGDTIRILTIEPGQKNDLLRGKLEAVTIDSAGNYEAISYVWGPPESAYDITICDSDDNERLLALRGESIFAILSRLRLADQPRRIWADQCCINQNDPVERSKQVQFMNRIYRDATRVLVWLGLDNEGEAISAFGLVRELDEALKSRPTDCSSRVSSSVDLERHIGENQKTLHALTNREWFKRGWVVQEIGTSTPATMIWGDAAIDWDTLARVCERLKSYHLLRSMLGITTSDISFLYRRFIEPDESTYHANRFNFVYELQRARHLRFSDDRDRVFAFLGHYAVHSRHYLGCGVVSIVADYTKTIEQTYIDVAVRILEANPASACILLASVQHARHSLPSCRETTAQVNKSLEHWFPDEDKLPSWVPDWRWSEGIILAEPICPHRAHGDTTVKLVVTDNGGRTLHIHGVRIDTVEQCSRPLRSKDFYDKKTSHQQRTMIESLWQEICRSKRFSLKDKYLNGEEAFFAFMQTLSNGCVQSAGHCGRSYYDVPDRVWLNMAAQYIVGISDDVSEEMKSAVNDAGYESDRDTWSRWATSASDGRVFARTERGYFVLGPAAMEAGDIVCVLFGAKVPFCLRPIGNRFLLVGECYVHGLMKGEAQDLLGRDEICEERFDVI